MNDIQAFGMYAQMAGLMTEDEIRSKFPHYKGRILPPQYLHNLSKKERKGKTFKEIQEMRRAKYEKELALLMNIQNDPKFLEEKEKK